MIKTVDKRNGIAYTVIEQLNNYSINGGLYGQRGKEKYSRYVAER